MIKKITRDQKRKEHAAILRRILAVLISRGYVTHADYEAADRILMAFSVKLR